MGDAPSWGRGAEPGAHGEVEGLRGGEGQGRWWVGLAGRRGGESVIWAPPVAQPPLPQDIGVVVSFLEDFQR